MGEINVYKRVEQGLGRCAPVVFDCFPSDGCMEFHVAEKIAPGGGYARSQRLAIPRFPPPLFFFFF